MFLTTSNFPHSSCVVFFALLPLLCLVHKVNMSHHVFHICYGQSAMLKWPETANLSHFLFQIEAVHKGALHPALLPWNSHLQYCSCHCLLLSVKACVANQASDCCLHILTLVWLQSPFLLCSLLPLVPSGLLCDFSFKSHTGNVKRSIFHSEHNLVKLWFSTNPVRWRQTDWYTLWKSCGFCFLF